MKMVKLTLGTSIMPGSVASANIFEFALMVDKVMYENAGSRLQRFGIFFKLPVVSYMAIKNSGKRPALFTVFVCWFRLKEEL